MSLWLTLGFVGFGASGGLFPEVRLGIFAVGCCRGAIGKRVRDFIEQVSELIRRLGGRK